MQSQAARAFSRSALSAATTAVPKSTPDNRHRVSKTVALQRPFFL
jgi:hypothetical protein